MGDITTGAAGLNGAAVKPAKPAARNAAADAASAAALRRHLDYLLQETLHSPFGEVRHFLGCALLALDDQTAAPPRQLRSGSGSA